MFVYVHILYIHIYIYTQIYTCINNADYAYIYIYIYTHTQIYTQTTDLFTNSKQLTISDSLDHQDHFAQNISKLLLLGSPP